MKSRTSFPNGIRMVRSFWFSRYSHIPACSLYDGTKKGCNELSSVSMRMPAIAFFVILGQLRPRWEAEGGGEQPPPIYPLAEAANSAGEMKFFLDKLIHNSVLCILRHACLDIPFGCLVTYP